MVEREYLADLLVKEKTLRQAEEVNAFESQSVLCEIIEKLKANNDWPGLLESIHLLTKKRRQPKQAIVGMIQQCMSYLDELPPDNELLHTLRKVCEGKIFVEVEFARLTKRLAKLKESAGNVKEASTLLQEVQVETYGSMEKHEKLEFLLEQLRLLLDMDEYIRFQIVSNKVNRKVLDEKGMEEEKARFLQYMIKYYDHSKEYMQVAISYKTLYETENSQVEPIFALQQLIIHLLLVPSSPEQIDLLRLYCNKQELDFNVRSVVNILLGKEVGWLPEGIEAIISEDKLVILRKRLSQHNIRIIQLYYKRITLAKLAEILRLAEDEAESELRDMVSYMGFHAKINRPEGYVYFVKPAQAQAELNDWGSDIFNLLQRMEEITHLIHRERLVVPNA